MSDRIRIQPHTAADLAKERDARRIASKHLHVVAHPLHRKPLILQAVIAGCARLGLEFVQCHEAEHADAVVHRNVNVRLGLDQVRCVVQAQFVLVAHHVASAINPARTTHLSFQPMHAAAQPARARTLQLTRSSPAISTSHWPTPDGTRRDRDSLSHTNTNT